jgi:DNA-binding NarL/FixJ family response regulator
MKAFGSVARPAVFADATPSVSGQYAAGSHVRDEQPHNNSRSVHASGFRGLPSARADHSPVSAQSVSREALHGVKILIVDDCMLYRDNLATALAANGAPAAGFAWDLPTLAAAMRETPVGVILLNIATRNSAALLAAAMAIDHRVRVVVLGVSDDDESGVIACAEAGVAGYHTRTESFEDLLVLIGKVAAGETLCSPRVSAILLRRLSTLAAQPQPAPRELVLTSREAQILGMLKMGMSNRDIAAQLCIAIHTVKNHVHSVLTKLGVSTRAEAAAVAHTLRYDIAGPEVQSRYS